MFKSIVVGTDGSDPARRAVQVAADLAETNGARLHVVSAVKPTNGMALMAGGMPTASDAEVESAVSSMLGQLASELRARGLEVETYCCRGEPAQVLVEMAETHGADLVVVGNRGMQGARRFLGSVPNSISHHAACSILIVNTR